MPTLTRRRRWVGIGIGTGAVILLVGVGAGWIGLKAVAVRDNLQATIELIPELMEQLKSDDAEGAATTVDQLSQRTLAAKEAGTDPIWRMASSMPWIGPNLSAATTISVAANDVVELAAKPLLSSYESLDWQSLTPSDGAVGLDALVTAAPNVATAATTVQLSHDRLAGIDQSKLMPQIADPLAQAQQQLDELRETLNVASSTVQLLPAMMGAEEPRNYLLLIQNSAEIRATGGIPGALAVLNADNGKLQLGTQDSATNMGTFEPALAVDAEQESIYTNRLGSYMQNSTMTPDFPTAATTAHSMWQTRHPGAKIDGVLTLDPSALALVLKATGPVDVSAAIPPGIDTGSLPTILTNENLVTALLSTVYSEIEDPDIQDAYFAEVAKAIFAQVSAGNTSGEKLISAFSDGVAENRIKLWSTHEEEQQLLVSARIGGAISGSAVAPAAFGVYFNDGTGAKMDYYVKRTVQLIKQCSANGYGQYMTRVTLTNTAPLDAASSLPKYVTGGGVFGVPPGHVATNVVAYGPVQARTLAARIDGASVGVGSYAHDERAVGVVRVNLAPGQSTTVEIDFGKIVQSTPPTLEATPTIQNPRDVILPLDESAICG